MRSISGRAVRMGALWPRTVCLLVILFHFTRSQVPPPSSTSGSSTSDPSAVDVFTGNTSVSGNIVAAAVVAQLLHDVLKTIVKSYFLYKERTERALRKAAKAAAVTTTPPVQLAPHEATHITVNVSPPRSHTHSRRHSHMELSLAGDTAPAA